MSQKRSLHPMICISLSMCLLLMATRQASPALVHASSSVDGLTGTLGVLVHPASAQPAGIETLNFTKISAGGFHTCGLLASGGVKCWGANFYGQLGDGTTTNRSTPVGVIGLASGVTAITTGSQHTCALLTGGGVKCWGRNDNGQIGDGTHENNRLTPVDVSGLTSGVIMVSAGGTHTCALLTGGGLKCWGENWTGALGDGTFESHLTPVDVSGLTSGVNAVSAGDNYTCALLASSGVQCWGYNSSSQLGNGDNANSNIPVDVSGLASGVSAVSASYAHTCALLTGGGMMCWGWNGGGQLGDGTTTDRSTPVEVIGLEESATAIATGGGHTCALLTVGGMKCWGSNWAGALGDGTTINRSTPVDVSGMAGNVTAITAGGGHTCALLSEGVMYCWGENSAGEIGDGTMLYRAIPVDVISLAGGLIEIKAGWVYTCALLSGGGVKCWGENESGQLGDGTTTGRSKPVDVFGLDSDVIEITAGWAHTCARLSGGGVKCWGGNMFGQLGDGTTEDRPAPVDVIGLESDVSAISAGIYHTCALLTSGGVQCWGSNSGGALGDGTYDNRLTPVDVSGLASGVTAITTGGGHACALLSSGGVKCWGANESGQLGDGSLSNRNTPVDVIGLASGVSAIAGGQSHTCALLSGGAVKCWGGNQEGQLGDGTTTDSSIPVGVNGLTSGVMTITTGLDTCAILTGGGMKCWGGNWSGELGDGTTTNRSTPVDVSGMAGNVTAITAGGFHTCALVGAGRPKCWGDDRYGQLGTGKVTQWLTPVPVIRSPSLGCNYTAGQPGSFFTITGWNFPPDAQLSLSINSQVLTTTLQVNPTGSFIIFLDTAGAEPGGYGVTVSGDPGTSSAFFLFDNAPLQPQEGGGLTFLVPADLALHNFVYFPMLKR